MFAVVALALARTLLVAEEPALVPGVDLVWRAPPGCPDAAAIADMVTALLHRPRAPGPDPPRVRAVVSRVTRGRWELRLDLISRRGRDRRVASADDCQVLARSAALLIAIHRDPLAAAIGLDVPAPPPPERVVPPPAPAPSPAADVLVPPAVASELSFGTDVAFDPSPSAPPPPGGTSSAAPVDPLGEDMSEETGALEAPRAGPAPRPVLAGHVRVDGGLDIGVLPGLGGHVGLFAGVSRRRVRGEAGVVVAPLRIAADDGVDARFDRVAGALRVCPLWSRRTVTFALCLGAEVGAIHGVARHVARPNPQWAAWLGVSLSPALRWRIVGPLGLYVALDGVVAVNRPRFSVNPGRELVFNAGRAGARATVGIELQFARRNR